MIRRLLLILFFFRLVLSLQYQFLNGKRVIKSKAHGVPSSSWQDEEALFDVTCGGDYFAGFWQLSLPTNRSGRLYLSSTGKVVAVPALETLLPESTIQGLGRGGSSVGQWRARRDTNDGLTVNIQLGRFSLQGRWAKPETKSRLEEPLRGVVLEGQVEADFVIHFFLTLAKAEVAQKKIERALGLAQTKRKESFLPPPPRFTMLHFLKVSNVWRLSMIIDDDQPAFYELYLQQNGSFASNEPKYRLAGSWGLFEDIDYTRRSLSSSKRRPPKGTGTHLWLWIRRSMCSGLNLHADLRLHGHIFHNTPVERELSERRATLYDNGANTSLFPSSVKGTIVYGDIPDMEYSALVGNFRFTPIHSESSDL